MTIPDTDTIARTSKTLLKAAEAVLAKQVWDSNCDCAKCKAMRALEAAVILETERANAPETNEPLRKAAHSLANEVMGNLTAFEFEIRQAISNTNYQCIMDKVLALKALIRQLPAQKALNSTTVVTMAKVYSIQLKADFLVLADDEQDAKTIASVLTDGIDHELPGSCVADLYAYRIPRQDEDMRKQCVNYEGHADTSNSSQESK